MILVGDVFDKLAKLQDKSVNCVVTSPPYWALRNYGQDGQLGLELTPQEYVENMVNVFREIKRVLTDDGTFWLNIGDSYKPAGKGSTKAGFNERYFGKKFQSDKQSATENHLDRSKFEADVKEKELVGIPWRLALALSADGWYLRQDIIWHKPNPMPESVRDRCTKAHEYLFLLTKQPKYYFNHEAMKEPAKWHGKDKRSSNGRFEYDGKYKGEVGTGQRAFVQINETRNRRSVWSITTKPFKGAHFAVMPEALVEPCILAGCPENGVVLDPFFGSGTVGLVALRNNRKYIGIELNPDYAKLAQQRLSTIQSNLWINQS